MVAHVMRDLRRQKIRLDKKKSQDALVGEAPPTITVRELADLFPTLSDGIIRSRLKDRCSCVSYKVSLAKERCQVYRKHCKKGHCYPDKATDCGFLFTSSISPVSCPQQAKQY